MVHAMTQRRKDVKERMGLGVFASLRLGVRPVQSSLDAPMAEQGAGAPGTPRLVSSVHMPEQLLEVGCEELPASFVRRALSDLLANVTSQLTTAGVLQSPGTALGTPRRLVVSFPDLRAEQEDEEKEVRGPGVRAAFGTDGSPTPALLGFCRSQGVEPGSLRQDEQHVYAKKLIPGRPTVEILSEALPKAIRAMSFDKTMRWGHSRMRFARPIRWLLATFDGSCVPFEIEGIVSGIQSHGHRFYSPDPFEARSLEDLITGLRLRKVELDPEERKRKIISQAEHVAGGKPDLKEDLVDENVFLTEWPTAIQGTFRTEFLSLPPAVLVTAMAKHEKMFPVYDDDDRLTNKFVFIRNSGENDSVRQGCEWVLNARFNDAKFFFDEDIKHDLDFFLEQTNGILFQERLGTVRQRADRLSALTEQIALVTGARGREIEFSRTAGKYAKADLSTGLVSELASLQGVIGGAYARRQGLFGSIAWAIETQYDISKNTDPGDCSGERTSLRLAMADQLDKLAGYLGLRHEPKGSSDPVGLRRAATILIEAAWMWHEALPNYCGLFEAALQLYADQGVALDSDFARTALFGLFASRYEAMLPDVRHDLLDAAMLDPHSAAVTMPRSVKVRTECMKAFSNNIAFIQTARRPLNIVTFARRDGDELSQDNPLGRLVPAAMQSAEGLELLKVVTATSEELIGFEESENVSGIVESLKGLAEPINRFFENTMVMADEPEVRYARLTLMHAVSMQLLRAGDFSKVVIEG